MDHFLPFLLESVDLSTFFNSDMSLSSIKIVYCTRYTALDALLYSFYSFLGDWKFSLKYHSLYYILTESNEDEKIFSHTSDYRSFEMAFFGRLPYFL